MIRDVSFSVVFTPPSFFHLALVLALTGLVALALGRWRFRSVGPVWLQPASGMAFLGVTGAFLLAGMALLWLAWGNVTVSYHYLGGIMPWSDANGYYHGAQQLLHWGALDAWNQRRPINALFLAARLGLTDNSFQGALIFQAAALSAALGCLAVALSRTLSPWAVALAVVVPFFYAALFLPSTMSEALGMTLAALALALLWHGVACGRSRAYYAGIFLATLALLVRAGPMLLVPALIVLGFFLLPRQGGRPWKHVAWGAVAALLPVGFSFLLLEQYGGGGGALQGNFAYVLYGLAVGGKNWTQAWTDFPQIAGLSEAAGVQFVYSQAFREIVNHPQVFAGALLSGLVTYPLSYLQHLLAAGFWADEGGPMPKGGALVVALVLLAGLVRALRNNVLRPLAVFFGGSLLACVVSLPFVYGNGGLRTMTVSIPFSAAAFSLALTALLARRKRDFPLAADGVYAYHLPLAMGLAFMALVLAAPAYFHRHFPAPPMDGAAKQPRCGEGQTLISVWLGPGIPFVDLTPDSGRHSFVPEVSERDFRRISPSNELRPVWREISGPATVASVFDVASGKQKYLLGPLGMVPPQFEFRHLCGSPSPRSGYLWFVSPAGAGGQDSAMPALGF